MQARHARFYDQAFGNQPSNWKALSPTLQLHQAFYLISLLFVQQLAQINHVFKHNNLFNKRKDSAPQAQLLALPISHILK